MLNDNMGVSDCSPCKPDPEETLQRFHKQAEETEEILEHFKAISNGNLHLHNDARQGLINAIGQATLQSWELEKNIARVLKDIDEEK